MGTSAVLRQLACPRACGQSEHRLRVMCARWVRARAGVLQSGVVAHACHVSAIRAASAMNRESRVLVPFFSLCISYCERAYGISNSGLELSSKESNSLQKGVTPLKRE